MGLLSSPRKAEIDCRPAEGTRCMFDILSVSRPAHLALRSACFVSTRGWQISSDQSVRRVSMFQGSFYRKITASNNVHKCYTYMS